MPARHVVEHPITTIGADVATVLRILRSLQLQGTAKTPRPARRAFPPIAATPATARALHTNISCAILTQLFVSPEARHMAVDGLRFHLTIYKDLTGIAGLVASMETDPALQAALDQIAASQGNLGKGGGLPPGDNDPFSPVVDLNTGDVSLFGKGNDADPLLDKPVGGGPHGGGIDVSPFDDGPDDTATARRFDAEADKNIEIAADFAAAGIKDAAHGDFAGAKAHFEFCQEALVQAAVDHEIANYFRNRPTPPKDFGEDNGNDTNQTDLSAHALLTVRDVINHLHDVAQDGLGSDLATLNASLLRLQHIFSSLRAHIGLLPSKGDTSGDDAFYDPNEVDIDHWWDQLAHEALVVGTPGDNAIDDLGKSPNPHPKGSLTAGQKLTIESPGTAAGIGHITIFSKAFERTPRAI